MSGLAENDDGVSVMGEMREGSPHETVQRHDPVVSDEARRVLEIIFYSTLCGVFGAVGSVANVVNIIVFVKQGFSDSVGISLCALAVSDLGWLLMIFSTSVCSNPLLQDSDTSYDTSGIIYITGGIFASCFLRTTHLITAFITFERCFCIALPLKVKNIITPKRTLTSMMTIFVFIFAVSMPVFSYMYSAPSFNAKRNKTMIVFMYTTTSFDQGINSLNVALQLSTFIAIIICTTILVLKLLSKSEWRQKATSTSHVSESISTRDKRAMRMVTIISTIFISCYVLNVVNLLLTICLSPDYSVGGFYENSYLSSWAIVTTLDSINSSVSILVYYNMSSKFRATFQGFFFISKGHT